MTSKRQTRRITYVDRLRGLAVVGMFLVHSAVAWLEPSTRNSQYWRIMSYISGMVAPVFMFLAGLSIALIAHQGRVNGSNETDLRRRVSLRGVKILILGYAVHLIFFLLGNLNGPWIKVLKVDILHCIGFGLALFPWIAWPKKRFNWTSVILFVVLVVGAQITFRLPLEQWFPTAMAAYISLRPAMALFPPMPYAAWIALGLFIGAIWAPVARHKEQERRFWLSMSGITILILLGGLGLKWVYYSFHLDQLGGSERPTRGIPHFSARAVASIVNIEIHRVAFPASSRYSHFSRLGITGYSTDNVRAAPGEYLRLNAIEENHSAVCADIAA